MGRRCIWLRDQSGRTTRCDLRLALLSSFGVIGERFPLKNFSLQYNPELHPTDFRLALQAALDIPRGIGITVMLMFVPAGGCDEEDHQESKQGRRTRPCAK